MFMDPNTGFCLEAERRGEVSTVSFYGELDLSVKEAVDEELEQALADAPGTLALDLRRLEFMDSSGVNLLAATHSRCRREGVRLCVIGASPQLRRLLGSCGLGDFFELVPAPDELLGEPPAAGLAAG